MLLSYIKLRFEPELKRTNKDRYQPIRQIVERKNVFDSKAKTSRFPLNVGEKRYIIQNNSIHEDPFKKIVFR